MPTAHLIEEYVQGLDRRLTGPRRVKRDLLTEARDSLVDATEAYEAAGLAPRDAQARAVAEFGAPGPIAAAYQTELAASLGRRLAVLVTLVPIGAMLFGDQMWKGSPWSGSTTAPADYLIVARALDWATVVLAGAAVAGFVGLRRQARSGGNPLRLCRMLSLGMIATLGLITGLGATIWVSTMAIWPAALTWPPMIIGGVVLAVVFAALLAIAVRCLRLARAVPDAMPVPVASSRPETC